MVKIVGLQNRLRCCSRRLFLDSKNIIWVLYQPCSRNQVSQTTSQTILWYHNHKLLLAWSGTDCCINIFIFCLENIILGVVREKKKSNSSSRPSKTNKVYKQKKEKRNPPPPPLSQFLLIKPLSHLISALTTHNIICHTHTHTHKHIKNQELVSSSAL